MVKQRNKGRVVDIHLRVVYGDPTEVLALLEQSTAYIERTHLTMRHFNSRLVRKTLAFSKQLEMHRAAAAWEDAIYNLTRPPRSKPCAAKDTTTPDAAGSRAPQPWLLGWLTIFGLLKNS